MGFVHACAAAGVTIAVALSWVAFEIRALRHDRRAIELELDRIRRDEAMSASLLASMRLADEAEKARRARDSDLSAAVEALVDAMRTLLGRQDQVSAELVDEIRELTRAITSPVGASRPAPTTVGAELLGARRPVIPPPPPLPDPEDP